MHPMHRYARVFPDTNVGLRSASAFITLVQLSNTATKPSHSRYSMDSLLHSITHTNARIIVTCTSINTTTHLYIHVRWLSWGSCIVLCKCIALGVSRSDYFIYKLHKYIQQVQQELKIHTCICICSLMGYNDGKHYSLATCIYSAMYYHRKVTSRWLYMYMSHLQREIAEWEWWQASEFGQTHCLEWLPFGTS